MTRSNRPTITNLDLFTLVARQSILDEKPSVPDEQEVRCSMYQFKILGLFWFEGSLPQDPNQSLSYYMNEDWPSGPPPRDIDAIMSMSEIDLEARCRKMQRPAWIRNLAFRESSS